MSVKGTAIVCIGNRYVKSDDLGPRVYDSLARRGVPEDVLLVDGGLMGLDLLRFTEGRRRVIFVDALHGFAPPGCPVLLDRSTALEERPAVFGHDGGLAYLLRMLPAICGKDLPDIAVVGAEPPIGPDLVAELADLALSTATGEKDGRKRNRSTDAAQPGTP